MVIMGDIGRMELAVVLALSLLFRTSFSGAKDDGGSLAGPGGAQQVLVLCPDDLAPAIPGCAKLAQALAVEVEEFSMTPITGPTPWAMPVQDMAGPGIPFVLWVTEEPGGIVLHVFDASNDIELYKVLDTSAMAEPPGAADLAILFKNLMGTSLYADLAAIEDDDAMFDLAVPAGKEKIIVGHASSKAGEATPHHEPMWMPQFTMGWALVSHPDVNNTRRGGSDVYNGLMLSIRFPIGEKIWAGASLTLTQSITGSFLKELDPTPIRPVYEAMFVEDHVAIALDGAFFPLVTKRVSVWTGLSPGIIRSSMRLIVVEDGDDGLDKIENTYPVWRMSLSAGAGIQLTMVPRVALEMGLNLGYCFNISGADQYVFDYRSEHGASESYRYFMHGSFRIGFWLAMVFG